MSYPKQVISKLSDALVVCMDCETLSPVSSSWELTGQPKEDPIFICNRCAVRDYAVRCILCEGTGEIFNAGVYIACPDCKS